MFWAISWFVSGYWLGKRAVTQAAPPALPAGKPPISASTQADADAMYQAATGLGKGNGQ